MECFIVMIYQFGRDIPNIPISNMQEEQQITKHKDKKKNDTFSLIMLCLLIEKIEFPF